MPNPNPPMRPKIADIGLERHLNATMGDHNGCDYAEFVKRLQLKEPKTVIARAFNVSTFTIYHWIWLYEQEQSRGGRKR